VTLTGQVVPAVASAQDLGAVNSAQQVNVEILLQRDDRAVAQYESQLNDPKSPLYQQWLTPDQFAAQFGVPATTIAAVQSFATAQGLSLVNADSTGDLVVLTGTAAQAQKTFKVALHNFRDASGRNFFANTAAVSVPSGLGIQAVLGLENWHQMHLAPLGAGTGMHTDQQGACGPSPAAACIGLLGPQDLWAAYNAPANNLGQGQTVGVIGEGQTSDVIAALRRFETSRGLPYVPVQVVHAVPYQDVAGKADDAGRIEWEMDTQSSTAMAPHVDQVRLYFASDLSLSGFATSVQTWASDPKGPNQVSASLGSCEESLALDQLGALADRAASRALAQGAMEGRAFFASAGDTGAGCGIGAVTVNGVTYGPGPWPEFPAVDPNVTAVGGTVVYTDGGTPAKRVDEHAWDHSGGTRSYYVPQPAYQSAVPLLQTQYCVSQEDGTPYPAPQLCRGTVDVSALSGDGTIVLNHAKGSPAAGIVPANGFDMVDTADQGVTYNDHFSEGGTSLSSPLWLGMWARVNAAHKNSKGKVAPLGPANQTLYPIAQKSATAAAFHDIVEGANPLPALPGWDFPTGLGTPDLTLLTAAANGGNTKPVRMIEPGPGPDPAPIDPKVSNGPKCATFIDAGGDASTTGVGGADNLDIVEGDLAPTADKHSLRVSLTLTNMNETYGTGTNDVTYNVFWNPVPQSDGSVNYTATQVDISLTPGSDPVVTYSDGVMNVNTAQGLTQYTSSNTDTGTIVTGANGRVEVDVPLANIGNPAAGAHLTSINAQTAASTAALGFIADQAAASKDYTIGTKSCLK
jgi:subtilase family serine protease